MDGKGKKMKRTLEYSLLSSFLFLDFKGLRGRTIGLGKMGGEKWHGLDMPGSVQLIKI